MGLGYFLHQLFLVVVERIVAPVYRERNARNKVFIAKYEICAFA